MKFNLIEKTAAATLIATVFALQIVPQTAGGGSVGFAGAIGRAWKGPAAGAMGRILSPKASNRSAASLKQTSRPTASRPNTSVDRVLRPSDQVEVEAELTFRPRLNSGVEESLAAALSPRPSDKENVRKFLQEIKQEYDSEAFIKGRSHNIAAAMTYFVIRTTVVHEQGYLPPEATVNTLLNSFSNAMQKAPEIARMSDLEKQQMHDWLVYMGGFVYAGYVNARRTNNAESVENFRGIAATAAKTVGLDLTDTVITDEGLETKKSSREFLVPEHPGTRVSFLRVF